MPRKTRSKHRRLEWRKSKADTVFDRRRPVGDQVYFLKASDRPEKLDGLEPALKEIATAMKAGESGEIDWGLPEGWLKKPGTGPVVSAVLQSPVESGSVNFTVTQLSGPPNPDAWDNYLEVNINRWRGQLSLPPNTIAEQKPDLVKIDREGLESAWLVDLRTDDATSPPNPTPQQNTLPSDSPGPISSNSSPASSKPKYKTPEGWTDEGPKGMRVASFVVAEGDSKGEVTVIIAGGDREANVVRWQGQVSPVPIRKGTRTGQASRRQRQRSQVGSGHRRSPLFVARTGR